MIFTLASISCLNYHSSMIQKIISGGQTGADRAALDWAIKNGLPHGGWCPKGRRAEDGIIPEQYALSETPGRDYRQRTKRNVRAADATLIISLTKDLAGGTLFTRDYAKTIAKPYLHVFPSQTWRRQLETFLGTNVIRTLNVAGPRLSSAPGIERFVHEVMNEMRVYRDEQ
jgi:hypothetical protein